MGTGISHCFFMLKMKKNLTIENMKLKKVWKNLHFRKKWI